VGALVDFAAALDSHAVAALFGLLALDYADILLSLGFRKNLRISACDLRKSAAACAVMLLALVFLVFFALMGFVSRMSRSRHI
jgi:hypothetical protein